MPLTLTSEDVTAYARGCALLGSGGGGDVSAAAYLLRALIEAHGEVHAIPPEDLREQTVVLVGAVGSPTVMTERVPSGAEFAAAVDRLEAATGRALPVVAPLEIGGVNGLLGVAAAVTSGRTLVDADGMGRAFARLDQCVLAGSSAAVPLALVDPSGGVLVVEGIAQVAVERTVRGVLPALGTWAAIACHLTPGPEFARAAVPHSITRALTLGRYLLDRSEGAGPDDSLAQERATATVLEVLRDDSSRLQGVVTLADDEDPSTTWRVDFVEEYACLLRDGVLAACAPDIIALVDARTWAPIGVGEVRVGQRVRVLVLLAPDVVAAADPSRYGLAAYALAPTTGGPLCPG